MTAQQSPFSEDDSKALQKLQIFSILFLVTIAAGLIIGFGTGLAAGLEAMTSRGTASASGSILTGVAASIVVAGVIEFIGIVQLRSAFTSLARVDPRNFSMPAKLSTLMLIGLPVVYLGVAVLFGLLSPLFSGQSSTASVTGITSADLGYLIASLLLLFVGGIAALVGFIGGLMLGLWRVGSRYDADTIKAAAIIFIIPLITIIAPILILVGVSNVSMNLRATGTAQG